MSGSASLQARRHSVIIILNHNLKNHDSVSILELYVSHPQCSRDEIQRTLQSSLEMCFYMYNWELIRQDYSAILSAKAENRQRYCCLNLGKAINALNLRRQDTEYCRQPSTHIQTRRLPKRDKCTQKKKMYPYTQLKQCFIWGCKHTHISHSHSLWPCVPAFVKGSQEAACSHR